MFLFSFIIRARALIETTETNASYFLLWERAQGLCLISNNIMGKSSVDSQIREGEEEEEDTQTKKEKNIRDEEEQEQESKAPKLVAHFASARKHLFSTDI